MKIVSIKHSLQSFRQEPDRWFFYFFLFSLPFSIRKIIWFHPINGQFNEYTDISLYLSDVLLLITLLTCIFILNNKYSILSILKKCSTWNIHNILHSIKLSQLFHVEQHRFSTALKIILLPALLTLWPALSILWSPEKSLSTYYALKSLEFFSLYVYVLLRIVPRATNETFSNCSTWNTYKSHIPSTILINNNDKEKNSSLNVTRGTLESQTSHTTQNTQTESFTWNILVCVFLIFSLIGFFESILGIFQFIGQHSLGLTYFKESIFNPEMPGVAKIIFNGEAFIRSYGTFPHPNILGGFLLMSILFTHLILKIFHVEQFSQHKKFHFFSVVLIFQHIGLLFSFSKSAILGLLIALTFLWIQSRSLHFVPRGIKRLKNYFVRKIKSPRKAEIPQDENNLDNDKTIGDKNVPRGILNLLLFHLKQKYLPKVIFFILMTIGFIFILHEGQRSFLVSIDNYSFFWKSLQERSLYETMASEFINIHSFLGIGGGQFVYLSSLESTKTLLDWQFQPVHNVFLLIWAELGFIGILLFLSFLYTLLLAAWEKIKVSRGTNALVLKNLMASLIGFLFIGFFDHYLWDIQQGQLLFWLICGLLGGIIWQRSGTLEENT